MSSCLERGLCCPDSDASTLGRKTWVLRVYDCKSEVRLRMDCTANVRYWQRARKHFESLPSDANLRKPWRRLRLPGEMVCHALVLMRMIIRQPPSSVALQFIPAIPASYQPGVSRQLSSQPMYAMTSLRHHAPLRHHVRYLPHLLRLTIHS